MPCRPIGLFDSGVGGLSVLQQLRRQMPQEETIYFADTQHMPYGSRRPEDLHRIVSAILHFLQEQDTKLVIMACNTSSALVLPGAESVFPLPIVGMIKPVVAVLAQSRIPLLGVLATEATVNSDIYRRKLNQAGFTGHVHSQACPQLASLIEAGVASERIRAFVTSYVAPLQEANVKDILLGCTHYPFASEIIRAAMGYNVHLIDPAQYVVAQAKDILCQANLLRKATDEPQHQVWVSGDRQLFMQRAQQLLGYSLPVRQVYVQEKNGRINFVK